MRPGAEAVMIVGEAMSEQHRVLLGLAYRGALLVRLSASKHTEFMIHHVVGYTVDAKIRVSRFVAPRAHGLDPSVRWRFQTVHHWYRGSSAAGRATSRLLPVGMAP
jgi:hypothetical protein